MKRTQFHHFMVKFLIFSMKVIFLAECLVTWPIISVLVICDNVSGSRPDKDFIHFESSSQCLPVKEDFDSKGYEVLGLFSMILSRAATCLKSKSEGNSLKCLTDLFIRLSLTGVEEPEGKFLLKSCLRPSPISLPCLFLSTGHFSSTLTKPL